MQSIALRAQSVRPTPLAHFSGSEDLVTRPNSGPVKITRSSSYSGHMILIARYSSEPTIPNLAYYFYQQSVAVLRPWLTDRRETARSEPVGTRRASLHIPLSDFFPLIFKHCALLSTTLTVISPPSTRSHYGVERYVHVPLQYYKTHII